MYVDGYCIRYSYHDLGGSLIQKKVLNADEKYRIYRSNQKNLFLPIILTISPSIIKTKLTINSETPIVVNENICGEIIKENYNISTKIKTLSFIRFVRFI